MTTDDPNKQNLSVCIARADCALTNDGTLEELQAQIDRAMAQLDEKRKTLPSSEKTISVFDAAAAPAASTVSPGAMPCCVRSGVRAAASRFSWHARLSAPCPPPPAPLALVRVVCVSGRSPHQHLTYSAAVQSCSEASLARRTRP
jgi:hypothetical protein